MLKPVSLLAAAILGAVSVNVASGAIVLDASSWSYQTLTSADSLAPTAGTTAAAFNFAGAAASLGGVSFSAAAAGNFASAGGITIGFSVPGVSWAGGASGAYTIPSTDAVLSSFEYTSGNNGLLEVSGLTPGQAYTFQFILADQRSFNQPRQVQIVGGANNGADVTGTSNLFQYGYQGQDSYGAISATFTADSSGKAAFYPRTYASDGTTSVGTQLNALQIIAVPEPSSILALIGGTGVLLGLRRRRF
jgi:hypothetical protein